MIYVLTEERKAELARRFTYHPPLAGQPERYSLVRDHARDYAELLCNCCPDSRELSSALTRLEECVMHANAAIARNEIHRDD